MYNWNAADLRPDARDSLLDAPPVYINLDPNQHESNYVDSGYLIVRTVDGRAWSEDDRDVLFVAGNANGRRVSLTQVETSDAGTVQRNVLQQDVVEGCFVRGPVVPALLAGGDMVSIVYIEACNEGTYLRLTAVPTRGGLQRERRWPVLSEHDSFSELWVGTLGSTIVVGYQSDGMFDSEGPMYYGGGKNGVYVVIDAATLKLQELWRRDEPANGLVHYNGTLWLTWGRGRDITFQAVDRNAQDFHLDLEALVGKATPLGGYRSVGQ